MNRSNVLTAPRPKWASSRVAIPIILLMSAAEVFTATLTLQQGVTPRIPSGTYEGTSDSWVNEGLRNYNYGGSSVLEIKYDANDEGYAEDHALIKFELPYLDFESITQADLELFFTDAQSFLSDNALGIKPYRVPPLLWWDENDGDESGKSGEGVNFRFRDVPQTLPWTGEFGGWYDKIDDGNGTNRVKRTGGTATNAIEPGNWVKFDVTPSVTRWYSGTENNGLFLFSCWFEGSGSTATAKFASRNTNSPTYRPKLTIAYNGAKITWTGNNGNLWDSNSANWNVGGYLGRFGNGDHVLFTDGVQSTNVIITNAGAMPKSVTISNHNLTYSFVGGPIGGDSSLTKAGSGTATLGNSNYFSGVVIVKDGKLVLSTNWALGNLTSGTIISNGAALGFQNVTYTAPEPIYLTGSGPDGMGALQSLAGFNLYSGPITLAGNATIGAHLNSTLTLSNAIIGTGNLTIIGPGTVQLAGPANSYSGSTYVQRGTLILQKTGPAIPADLIVGDSSQPASVRLLANDQLGGPVTLLSGSELAIINCTNTIPGNLVMSNGIVSLTTGEAQLLGDILASGTSQSRITGGVVRLQKSLSSIAVQDTPHDVDLEISAAINGNALQKLGSGRLLLSGSNNITGPIVISQGDLTVASPNALGTPSAGTVVEPGASITFQNIIYAYEEPLSVSGAGNSGLGAICATGGNMFPGSIEITGDTTINVLSNSTLSLTGNITGNGNITKVGLGSLIFSGNSLNSWIGDVFVNQGTLVLAKQTIPAINGALTIGDSLNQATVTIGAPNQLGSINILINQGGLLNIGDFPDQISGTLTLNGGSIATGLAPLTITVPIVYTGTTPSTISGIVDFSGNIIPIHVHDGPSLNDLIISASLRNGGIIKTGTGTLLLSGNNPLDGQITIAEGKLFISTERALGSHLGETIITNTGCLELSGDLIIKTEPLLLCGTGGGTGALVSAAKANTWNGPITVLSPASITVKTGSTLTIGGQLTIIESDLPYDLTLNVDGSLILNGPINGVSGTIIKQGEGILTIAGDLPNNFGGTLSINSGNLILAKTRNPALTGTLITTPAELPIHIICQAPDQFAPSATVILQSNSVLDLNGFGASIAELELHDATVETGPGTLKITTRCDHLGTRCSVISGYLDFSAAPTVHVKSNSVLQINASILTGGFSLVGGGTLLLRNTNYLTSECTIVGATLELAKVALPGPVLGPAPVNVLSNGILTGNGLISGDLRVTNSTVIPGATEPGLITVTGDLILGEGAELVIKIRNGEPDQIDLAHSGHVILSTNVAEPPSLELLGAPQGEEPIFIVRRARSISGHFNNLLHGAELPSCPGWYIHYDQHRIYISKVSSTIAYFRAFSINSNGIVMWRTAEEPGFITFDLYRWNGHEWQQVNPEPIPAHGAAGGIYALTNVPCEIGTTNLFLLVAHTTDGDEQWQFERTVTEFQFINPPLWLTNSIQLRWLSREDETYELQWTPDLMIPPIAITNVPATPPENIIIHYTTNPAGFYRIRMAP